MQKQPFTVLYPAGFLTGYATEKTAVFIYLCFYLEIYLQIPSINYCFYRSDPILHKTRHTGI